MTPSDREGLRALAEKATPGPWMADSFIVWREEAVPIMVPVCCGNALPSGECCGDAVPDVEWDRAQVQVAEVGGDNAQDDAAFIAACREAVPALLDENERMREARVQAVSLEGMQGEPAGMMTVRVHMTDGQSFDLIRSNGTVISHWARIPDAEARAALSPTQPEEVK